MVSDQVFRLVNQPRDPASSFSLSHVLRERNDMVICMLEEMIGICRSFTRDQVTKTIMDGPLIEVKSEKDATDVDRIAKGCSKGHWWQGTCDWRISAEGLRTRASRV